MRVMQVGGVSFGITPAQEVAWAELSARALLAAREGTVAAPVVRFRTDAGRGGSVPISARVPVVFADGEPEDQGRYLGTITHLGSEAEAWVQQHLDESGA
jgi:hypothetical protein